jgi:hypothetical protein
LTHLQSFLLFKDSSVTPMIRWFHKHLALSSIAGVILVGLGLVALLLPRQLSSWREKNCCLLPGHLLSAAICRTL